MPKTKKHLTAYKKRKIQEYKAAGLTLTQTAHKLHLCDSTVIYHWHEKSREKSKLGAKKYKEAKLAAMTPDEQVAYKKQQAKKTYAWKKRMMEIPSKRRKMQEKNKKYLKAWYGKQKLKKLEANKLKLIALAKQLGLYETPR